MKALGALLSLLLPLGALPPGSWAAAAKAAAPQPVPLAAPMLPSVAPVTAPDAGLLDGTFKGPSTVTGSDATGLEPGPLADLSVGTSPDLRPVAAGTNPVAAAPELLSVALPRVPVRARAARAERPTAAAVARELGAVLAEAPAAAPASAKLSADRVWDRAAALPDAPAVAAAVPSDLGPARLAPSRRPSRVRLMGGAAAALPAFLGGSGERLAGAWNAVGPYAQAGGIVIATYLVNRVAKWGVDKVAKAAKWRPNTKVAVRLVATIVLWTGGIALALKTGGATTSALVTTFGLGGVGVTMAVKDYIGNLIEGVKVLILRPFVMGDRVKIGDRTYAVKDMNLRYLVLHPEDLKKSETDMTYIELSATAFTVLKPYESRHKLDLRRPRLSLFEGLWRLPGSLYKLTKEMPRGQLRRATVWMALAVAVLVGLPFAKAKLGWTLLDATFPFLQAAAVVFATRSVDRWATGLIQRLSEKRGWNEQATLVVKLAVELLAWVIGGSIALNLLGLNWGTLLTALGATSVALGWASADILSNLFHGIWLLIKQPFQIGDTIEVEAFIGEVADMTLQYVVLDLGDGTHVLVPQSVLKGRKFTRLDPEDVPAAKARHAAAKAAKDAAAAAPAPAPLSAPAPQDPAPAAPSKPKTPPHWET